MGLRLARLFAPRVSDGDRTEAGLMVARDEVRRYKKRLEATAVNTREVVKVLVKERKRSKALVALRKLKSVEAGIQACEEQLLRLEQASLQVEETRRNGAVYEAMRAGTDLLQRIHQQVSVDDAQRLVEDTEAAYAYQQELDSILTGPNSNEEALLQELEPAVPSVQPTVPKAAIARPEVLPA